MPVERRRAERRRLAAGAVRTQTVPASPSNNRGGKAATPSCHAVAIVVSDVAGVAFRRRQRRAERPRLAADNAAHVARVWTLWCP
jgi:hypothetical protein